MMRGAVATLALGGAVESAVAGGILLYEAGQEGSGLANAGSAALATDPSILMNNPAGISALKGTQVSMNGFLVLGDVTFDRDEQNDFSGNEGGNAVLAPGSSFFVSHEVNDQASIGFGLYGLGLNVNYDDDWAGRYFTQESSLYGYSFQPTYSYKINEGLSLGIGPRFVYGTYRTEIAVNNNLQPSDSYRDGQLRYEDTDFGAGINLGLHYQMDERTTLGVSYTSKIDLEFEDRPEQKHIENPLLRTAFDRINLSSLELEMTFPQIVAASVAYKLDDQWTLLGSVNWQDWSEFGEIGVAADTSLGTPTRTLSREYQDTWHVSVGAQHTISPKLRWNMGVAYDTSAVDDEDRTVDNPMNDAWRFATGINYQMTEEMSVNMSYTLIWMGDMEIEQTKGNGDKLSGEYPDAALHVLAGGATWRF